MEKKTINFPRNKTTMRKKNFYSVCKKTPPSGNTLNFPKMCKRYSLKTREGWSKIVSRISLNLSISAAVCFPKHTLMVLKRRKFRVVMRRKGMKSMATKLAMRM